MDEGVLMFLLLGALLVFAPLYYSWQADKEDERLQNYAIELTREGKTPEEIKIIMKTVKEAAK